VYTSVEELLEPLLLCWRSLHETGAQRIALGSLLDLIRRVYAFGLSLVRLDIRQDAGRHREAIAEIVSARGEGNYQEWPEEKRRQYLSAMLNASARFVPRGFAPTPDIAEVLDTCAAIASESNEWLGSYVVSMAANPSTTRIRLRHEPLR
jgi:phosphoenolpyruvate carboxylase